MAPTAPVRRRARRPAPPAAALGPVLTLLAALGVAPAARAQERVQERVQERTPDAAPGGAAQPVDSAYTAQIRALTPTHPRWKFTTELVDHLPASATVPTPLKALGYVPGTVGRLSHVADINAYFRAVAAASPRVRVFSLGRSEEGRELIVAAVSDERTIQRLDEYRAMAARLADPRGVSAEERARLVREAKPIYWLTGSIHSPETGSPEMLMELVYRLAVEDTPFVRQIRDGVITLITPVTEVDGRDRMVDLVQLERALKVGRGGIPLVYWGKYVAHDNNRDGLVATLKLTQHVNDTFLRWRPTVLHDLHESVPFLYTSTGTGPYNEQLDPIVVGEWHQLAYQEITELTKRGLPGVWTHGFYDGWAPNYMFTVAQFRNAIGRFYETYTSMGADCHTVNLQPAQVAREWDRPNPPVNGVRWCIRSNVNYQQSGALVALNHVARNREAFLDNLALKASRMVERGRTQAPYAFVIPRGQRHAAEAADLVNYFRRMGSEVQTASADFTVRTMPPAVERPVLATSGAGAAASAGATGEGAASRDARAAAAGPNARPDSARRDSAGGDSTRRGAARGDSARAGGGSGTAGGSTVAVRAGDWIVRMDQPYTALVRTVLARQRYRADDPPPYDDTGWPLDALRHLTVHTVADSSVLARPMAPLTAEARVAGAVAGEGRVLVVPPLGDWRSASLPWQVGRERVTVADTAFAAGGATYPAGTAIVPNTPAARDAVARLGVAATALAEAPRVRGHTVRPPRIAYVHTWLETQNEGWVRMALEQAGVPFTYLSTQRLKEPGLLDRFDVVLFPHVSAPPSQVVNGRPMVGPAIPWRRSALTPNFGGSPDSTSDIRPGLGYDGLAALQRFVARGGLLVTEGNTTRLPIDMGFTSQVSVQATPRLVVRGAAVRAQAVERAHPVLYGYAEPSFPVYFNTAPVFAVASGAGGAGNQGGPQRDSLLANRPDTAFLRAAEAERPRVLVRFAPQADSLLIAGLLENGGELAGKPAVVDAPLGRGHVLLFAIRPMWRAETQGTYAMVLNALANWDAFDVNRRAPAPPGNTAVAAGEQEQDGH